MKKITMFSTLFLILLSAQVQADECKIDKVTLTKIETIMPARALGEVTLGALTSLLEGFCTGALFCNGVYKTIQGVNYAVTGKERLDFQESLDEGFSEIFNEEVFNGTDDLMVRINGVKVLPVSLADKSYPMQQGDIYPAQVSGFTLGTATVQLLEYDSGSDNDDLGSGEIFDENFLEFPVLPINRDTVTILATNKEDRSIYQVGYKLEPNVGNLEDVPERIICGRDECVDAREPMPKTFALKEQFTGYEVKDCPAGYDLVAFTSETVSSFTKDEIFNVCELHPDIETAASGTPCGSIFEPLTEVNDLEDGDIITLKSENLINGSQGQYQSSFYGQYLAICPDCLTVPAPDDRFYISLDAAFVHVLDHNRASAQWVVKKLSNGKIALQGKNGKYLAGCDNCGGASGLNAFVNVTNPTNELSKAQFTIEKEGAGFRLKIADSLSLTPLPLALEGEGDVDYIGYRYAANFPLVPALGNEPVWKISARSPDKVPAASYAVPNPEAFQFAFSDDISVKPTEIWEISAGQELTIDNGTTITVENGAKIVNYGTIINNGFLKVGDLGKITNFGIIVNKEAILIRDGVIQNTTAVGSDKKGVIDNGQANYFQNLGTLINEGYIYDPLNRLKGNNPQMNPVSSGYYLDGGLFGERACRLISGDEVSWNTGSSTCSMENLWLRAGKTLEISSGTTLVVNGSLINDGEIINNGIIDNSNGVVRQCGSYGPNGISQPSISNPGGFIANCTPSPAQTTCEAYSGAFNPASNECSSPRSVSPGETLTISGATWKVSVFTNSGTINIEESGAMEVIDGGGITNENNEGNGTIISYGEFRVGYDDSSAATSIFLNNGLFYNFGTIVNSGDIVGDGSIYNYCGSSYTLDHSFNTDPWSFPYDPEGEFHDIGTPVCTPPDSDSDGFTDDQDAFPDDDTQSADRDNDGFGDNLAGNFPDLFPDNRFEHADSDLDCSFLPIPADPELAGEGCGDNSDAFPQNNMEQVDSDLDCGYQRPDPEALTASSGNECGDNSDQFPLNPLETKDTDNDCPFILDSDQNTISGNSCGDNSDDFIADATQTRDSDGDGFGDNPDGNSPDPFIYDSENTKLMSTDNANGWGIGSALFSSQARGDEIPSGLPSGVDLPYGIFKVLLNNGAIGTESTITITYPEPLDPGLVWWKYGPTAINTEPHWYVFEGAVITGDTVTLTITDGGIGDDDMIANGKISDPGGPGLPPAETLVVTPTDDTDNTISVTDTPVTTASSGSSGGGGIVTIKLLFAMMFLVLIRLRMRQAIRQ